MTTEAKSRERHALLTTEQDTLGNNRKHSYIKCKHIVIIITVIIIIACLIIIFALDIFDLFTDSPSQKRAGMIGLWPTYGGNLQNQQTSPSNVILNVENIDDISIKCVYESEGGTAFIGYPTIDNENNSYFSDASGYITCINLDSCQQIWRQNVGDLLGFNNMTIITHQTLTIFRDNNGNEGLLLGAPSNRNPNLGFTNYPKEFGCFALAIHKNNGSFWWKIQIGNDYIDQDYSCSSFGFYVDGKYAFGGFTQSCCYDFGDDQDKYGFIGRFIKIDIDNHKIENIWYPFDYKWTQRENWDEYNLSYQGISIYNYPAIIDDYVVFGTSNLWRIPYKIQECLLNEADNYDEYLLLNESVSMDICGNDKSENKYFRCLPKDTVYPSSLIILNKNTMKLQDAHILTGLDIHMGDYQCMNNPRNSKLCPGYYSNQSIVHFNSDLTAVAIYKNKTNNKKYVVASQKPSRLHIFELESGKLHLTKKFGPRSLTAEFSIAVDEESMIGITSILGIRVSPNGHPRYKLSNNLTVCNGTGTIVAFDLNTGDILWEMVSPYGTINDSMCFNDTLFEDKIDYIEKEQVTCDSLPSLHNNNDNVNVHIPSILNETFEPLNIKERAYFRAPTTIVNNMVFIGGDSGDIYVRDLYNGSFIHQFQCPAQYMNDTYNRAAIRSGISIVNDRIVFYCGGYHFSRIAMDLRGNKLVSMKL